MSIKLIYLLAITCLLNSLSGCKSEDNRSNRTGGVARDSAGQIAKVLPRSLQLNRISPNQLELSFETDRPAFCEVIFRPSDNSQVKAITYNCPPTKKAQSFRIDFNLTSPELTYVADVTVFASAEGPKDSSSVSELSSTQTDSPSPSQPSSSTQVSSLPASSLEFSPSEPLTIHRWAFNSSVFETSTLTLPTGQTLKAWLTPKLNSPDSCSPARLGEAIQSSSRLASPGLPARVSGAIEADFAIHPFFDRLLLSTPAQAQLIPWFQFSGANIGTNRLETIRPLALSLNFGDPDRLAERNIRSTAITAVSFEKARLGTTLLIEPSFADSSSQPRPVPFILIARNEDQVFCSSWSQPLRLPSEVLASNVLWLSILSFAFYEDDRTLVAQTKNLVLNFI